MFLIIIGCIILLLLTKFLTFKVLGGCGAIHVLRILVDEDDSCKLSLSYTIKLKFVGAGAKHILSYPRIEGVPISGGWVFVSSVLYPLHLLKSKFASYNLQLNLPRHVSYLIYDSHAVCILPQIGSLHTILP